ncbi:MAG: 30S ribosomal protein S12 methylthiotransferase RimO [Methylacidiphilales bacterium]|nr:30S ribosomal protein S12 methylthiotransferase RimO [Candidatus Methylacidiphilales bacterium]
MSAPAIPSPARAIVKVGLVSLGCAKNLVDSEIMAGHLHQAGMVLTPDADEADVMIVNTCSFIDAAKEESIGAILEANQQRGMRRRHHAQKLIVAGCMAQRFAAELRTSMPEVDAFIGLDQLTQVAPIIEGLLAGDREEKAPKNFVTPQPRFIPDFDTPRFRLTPSHTAYVKIAEGCNHPCSFCIIPQMRGRHRSRTIESVVTEAKRLVAEGVRELNLISQDTTYFGMDRWEEKAGPRAPIDSTRGDSLTRLLRELQKIEGDFWIRLLYTHPAHWSDELIETIAACPKVARYVDMPLQHISDPMLEAMRRETSAQHIRDLIGRIRAGVPGIALRTTFIVGFPGETASDFETLLEFIEQTRFERLGVFRYSREDGTRAAKRQGHLPSRTKESRWKKAMALQRRIALEQTAAAVGRKIRVLVEAPGVARSEADAPEVDARVFVPKSLPVGGFEQVTVTAARGYDLVAE